MQGKDEAGEAHWEDCSDDGRKPAEVSTWSSFAASDPSTMSLVTCHMEWDLAAMTEDEVQTSLIAR